MTDTGAKAMNELINFYAEHNENVRLELIERYERMLKGVQQELVWLKNGQRGSCGYELTYEDVSMTIALGGMFRAERSMIREMGNVAEGRPIGYRTEPDPEKVAADIVAFNAVFDPIRKRLDTSIAAGVNQSREYLRETVRAIKADFESLKAVLENRWVDNTAVNRYTEDMIQFIRMCNDAYTASDTKS